MPGPSRVRVLLPGLALIAALTAVSYVLARVPLPVPVGALVIAMLVGLAWRPLRGLPRRAEPGVAFAARDLLKLGIVFLGVRLDFALLASVGPAVALGSVLVVGLGVWAIERLGRRLGLSRGLRLGIAVGTSICGASAVLAVASTTRIKDEEAGVAVGIISVVGTVGVIAYTVAVNVFGLEPHHYGLLVGLTLQEVAQVIAAGYVPGAEAGDVATVVKLARVALLAPALFVISSLLRAGDDEARRGEAPSGDTRLEAAAHGPALVPAPPPVRRLPAPAFLLGFLAVGVIASLGWLPPAAMTALEHASLLLTTAAMVGLGLRVDLSVFRRTAGNALVVGAVGFLGLVALVSLYLSAVRL